MKTIYLLLCLLSFSAFSCNAQPAAMPIVSTAKNISNYDTTTRTIHIFVALCDNQYQGIVPVPAKIGNGQDPNNNLYWGCAFGIRTYFKNSKEWKLLRTVKRDSLLMNA